MNPDIKVIWGLSDDDTLDEDAKVTILATGLNNELANELPDNHQQDKEENDYDAIIEQLYHPIRDGIKTPHQIEVEAEPTITDDSVEEAPENDSATKDTSETNSESNNDSITEPIKEVPKKLSLGDKIRLKLLQLAEDLDIVMKNEE